MEGPAVSADADVSEHVGPWTEADYQALRETANRIELVDGALVVSPIANRPHQRLALRLAFALDESAPSHLEVHGELNVRLGRDRILIPDLVVADNPGGTETFVDASHVVLVAEITSPSNAGIDRLLKPQLYAAAGIPHFLRIDLADAADAAPAAVAYRLRGERYEEVRRVEPGQILSLTEPFAAELDLADLAARTRPPAR